MFQNLINWIKGGFASMKNDLGVNDLVTIADHPLINVDVSEMARIKADYDLYRAKPADIQVYYPDGHQEKVKGKVVNFLQSATTRFASVLYNQNCSISLDNEEANTFLNAVLSENHFNNDMQRYLSAMLALGGLVIRPYWDADSQKIKIAWVLATNVYPLRSNTSEVSECAISSQTVTGSKSNPTYYTLLEFHRWENSVYSIDYEAYQSANKGIVGARIPLQSVYPQLEEHTEYNNLKSPLFVYMKPAKFNNLDPNSPLGVGFADNSIDTLKALDRTFSELNTEIETAKRMIALPGEYSQIGLDENGNTPVRSLNNNSPIFFYYGEDEASHGVVDLTSDLRIQQFKDTITHLINIFEMQNNVSSGTFSMSEEGQAITATQVVSENSTTYQTRNSYLTNIEIGLKQLVIAIFELAANTITNSGDPLWTGEIPSLKDVNVAFDDGVFEDKQSQTTFWRGQVASELASHVQAIMATQGVSEDAAKKIWAEIQAEQPSMGFPVDNSNGAPDPNSEPE